MTEGRAKSDETKAQTLRQILRSHYKSYLKELSDPIQSRSKILSIRNVICPKCSGTGAKDGKMKTCSKCGGKGVVMVNVGGGFGGFSMQM